MYNYLYYNIHVKRLSSSERNYIDDLVFEAIENNTIDHIPIKRCLMLPQYANSESQDLNTVIQLI